MTDRRPHYDPRAMPTDAVSAAIVNELRRRVHALRKRPASELEALPEVESETTTVEGQQVTFTTHSSRIDAGRQLVLVRSDRPILLGMGRRGTTEGFWIDRGGRIEDALFDDIADFFG